MVSKVTIFEPHFDGAQFGPASIETGQDGSERSNVRSEGESESNSRFVPFFQGATVFATLFVVLWVVLSRLLSDETEPVTRE